MSHRCKCDAENPNNAKFCRCCGANLETKAMTVLWYRIVQFFKKVAAHLKCMSGSEAPIKTAYETFPEISMTPTSLIKFRSSPSRSFLNFLIIVIALVASVDLIGLEYLNRSIVLHNYISDDTMYGIWVPYLLVGLWVLLYNKRKTIRLRLTADYIANSSICSSNIANSFICSSKEDIRVIIRKHKFGLYNFRKRKIVIHPKYSYISRLDEDHVWIKSTKDGVDKYGIYSLCRKRVIAYPIYDSGTPFVNSIATLKLNGQNVLIDVTGNILR